MQYIPYEIVTSHQEKLVAKRQQEALADQARTGRMLSVLRRLLVRSDQQRASLSAPESPLVRSL